MSSLRESILDSYNDYTQAFQSAYLQFADDPGVDPNKNAALSFYHTPCMFISYFGINHYLQRKDLASYFQQVMHDMSKNNYLRTAFGMHHITILDSRTALVSLEITRFDVNEKQYDQYGCTYTFHRDKTGWKIAVVTTHPASAVIKE